MNVTPPPEPVAEVPTEAIDPVAEGMTTKGVMELCDRHLGRARLLLAEVKGLSADTQLAWENTLAKVDRIAFELSVGAGFPELMNLGHPDKDVREAAKGCRPKVDEFYTDLMLDAEFARVIQRYADSKPSLTGTRQRLLDELLRDFKRNGLFLSKEDQTRLRELNEQLTQLGQDFTTNLSEARGTIRVKPEQLKGLPESFIDSHKPGADGLVELTTDYPDYFPVVSYAEDRSVAAALTREFDSRAAKENVPILEKVLTLREQKAKLLGYDTWADYSVEPRMAKSAARVRAFLKQAADLVAVPGKAEYAELQQEWLKSGANRYAPPGQKAIPNHDRLYLVGRVAKRKFGFDSKELSEYFEVGAVSKGLFTILEQLYGIQLMERTPEPGSVWHEDVRVLEVMDGGKKLARIYLDLYPREGKYKHAAMFEIRSGRRLPDGSYVTPISALVCNFPKSEPGQPGLMTHDHVATFFHEFGHALHHALTTQELATYAGTNTARDFVEAPSQMLEEWAFRRETLDLFARHHKTGEPIPDALFQAMTKSRTFGQALHTQRQISLATLDFEYHSRKTPVNTDAVFQEVMQKTQSFSYLPNTHFQATFGHLMGYDAAYYGYQWALAIARDVLTRFQKEGFMNQSTARDWRRLVLSQGAGADENQLVKDFLGREPNLDAYAAFLAGK
ncbi:MAG: Zn-dependent oligopeptidase [Polyangiaceae bacterium]|nr:Zn-dependent oligopeptidase [Polyangiaceae bacterium]MCW5789729.1 Zn-dependent oligopeptidase [Polyangiaceae bacterium]